MNANFKINDDNIINLIEKSEEKFIKSPRYKSIHKEKLKCEITKMKSAHKTLGVPKVSLKSPKDFLKKKSHLQTERQKVDHIHYRRPGYQHQLPKWTPLKMCISSSKDNFYTFSNDLIKPSKFNFRKQNIENVKNFVSKPINLKQAYTCHGDNHELIRSGLIPTYIHKKNYGRVPSYLKRNSFTICSNKNYSTSSKQNCNEQYTHRKSCRYITQEDREKILKDMKVHWSEIMKQFQCLPFLIDTAPKIKRKLVMEQKLRQIEKDIDLLEKHKYIYVCDDEDIKY